MDSRVPAVLVLLMLAVAGCSSGSGGSGASGSRASFPAPPAPGTTRVFAVDRNGRHSTRTVTLLAVRTVGSDVRETIRSAETGGRTVTGVFVRHADGSVDDPTQTTVFPGGVTLSVPGIEVPTPKTLLSGKVVHENRTIRISAQRRILRVPDTISINGDKAVTVHVPAGTFRATPVTLIEDFVLDGQATTEESTVDVAPGVGSVRLVIVVTQGSTTRTATEVLMRYHGGRGVVVQA